MRDYAILRSIINLYFRTSLIIAASYVITISIVSYFRTYTLGKQLQSIFPNEAFRLQVLIFLATLLAYILINVFDPRISHLQHKSVIRVIPVWLSVSFGILLAAFVDISEGHPNSSRYLEWGCIGVPSVLLAGLLTWTTLSKPTSSDPSRTSDNGLIHDYPLTKAKFEKYRELNPKFEEWWKKYGEWLSSTDPTVEDHLEVGLESIAQRLLDSINNETVRTIGLVGSYGSGKSSAIALLKAMARSQGSTNRLVICEFSCWGIEDPEKAVSDLIEACLEEVSLYVDVFPVKSLGRKYRDSVSKGDGYLDRISTFIWGESSFRRMLAELDEILTLARIRLVIVIEDLDRTSGDKFDPDVILAFLFSLRDFISIRSILAADIYGSQSLKVDYLKLCDHIEDMVSASSDTVLDIAEEFREMCLQDERFLKINEAIDVPNSVFDEWMNQDIGFIDSPSGSVAHIIGRPRVFKMTLSSVLSAWVDIAGEICWDDLFVLSAIKTIDGEFYKFIKANYEILNSMKIAADIIDRENSVKFLKKNWIPLEETRLYLSEHVLTLICYIFPWTPLIDIKGNSYRGTPRQPHAQGYWINHYRRRFETMKAAPKPISDYTVVTDYLEYLSSGISSTITTKLLSPKEDEYQYDDAWGHLVMRFKDLPTKRLYPLCLDLNSKSLEKHGASTYILCSYLAPTLKTAIRASKMAAGISPKSTDDILQFYRDLLVTASKHSLDSIAKIRDLFLDEYKFAFDMTDKFHISTLEILKSNITSHSLLTSIISVFDAKKEVESLTRPIHNNIEQVDYDYWRWFYDTLTNGLLENDGRTTRICAQLVCFENNHMEIDIDWRKCENVFGSRAIQAIPKLEAYLAKNSMTDFLPNS